MSPTLRDLRVRMWDNVGRVGAWLPRWCWHLGRALVACAGWALFWKGYGHGRFASAVAAALAVGLVPHVVGLVSHAYPFDWKDWCADFWIACAPLAVACLMRWGTDALWAPALYVLGYVVLYPYARP